MNQTWLGRALAAVTGLVLLAQPVAAQTSTTEDLIWGLNTKLLVVAIPITLLTEGILIYTVWKYSQSDEAKPTKENRRLEITWTVATAVILLFVGFSAYTVLGQPAVTTPQDANMEDGDVVNVTAVTWQWHFQYDDYNMRTTDTVYVQKGETVYFNITSKHTYQDDFGATAENAPSDGWLHAFHVPGLGLKQDAVPGQYNVIQTTPQKTGTYQGYCAEYCGSAHSGMLFTVVVVEDEEALENRLQEECEGQTDRTWDNETATCTDTGGEDGSGADSGGSGDASGNESSAALGTTAAARAI
jgi:cytochrome c oxidase subunit 2